jgi:hypothetical protein
MDRLNMAKQTMRGTFKRFFDVGSWLGLNEIKRNTGNIKDLFKALFTVQKPEIKETFDQAVSRYNLNSEDLEEKKNMFFKTSMVYLAALFCMLLYTIYLFINELYKPAFMAIAFSCVLFSMFFREHFWYTQIKSKRLGFTFVEWFFSLFK